MFIDFSCLCASYSINFPFPLKVCEYVNVKSEVYLYDISR